MLEVFSRLGFKVQSDLHNINENSKGWVDIDKFFSPKYANKKDAELLKSYLTKVFGPDYENHFYQDGKDTLTRKFEQKLSNLSRSKTPVHFGNNMVDCRIWTIYPKNSSKELYLLQFDEPKTPPTKMLLGRSESIQSIK